MPKTNNHTFADVIFPQNIRCLTYGIPDELMKGCVPGAIVEAPLRGKKKVGMAVKVHADYPAIKGLKNLSRLTAIVDDLRFTSIHVKLLKWVSDYYMCNEGLALMGLLHRYALDFPTRKREGPRADTASPPALPDTSLSFHEVAGYIEERTFRTILFHAPSMLHEISMIVEIIRKFERLLILVPEKYDLGYFLPSLETSARDRYCLLHGLLNKTATYNAYTGLSNASYDIAIGTMQTVFSPVHDPSLIIVCREHSPFYKHEESPLYNVRDVAIKRASLEKIPVLLTSISPSFESLYNARKGKYTLVSGQETIPRPGKRIINAGGSDSIVTSPLKKTIGDVLNKKRDVLLILNRKGHSILQCGECGHIDICPNCNVPYVFHAERQLQCHYCDISQGPPDRCTECQSYDLKNIGSGTEKAFELLTRQFDDRVVLIDREHGDMIFKMGDTARIFLGTDRVLRAIPPFHRFGLTALLNADVSLHKPDFRMYERLFQHIISISERTEDGGTMIVQTYDWKNSFFTFVKNDKYLSFFDHEMKRRRDFNYPPFCKLAVVAVKKASYSRKSPEFRQTGINVLGPVEKRTGKTDWIEFLIKGKRNVRIQDHLDTLIKGIAKNRKDLKIDIDPLVFR